MSWLSQSSVGRKFVMGISGAALVLFVLFHGTMNVVSIFSPKGYNAICEFLGANWYALIASMGLALLVIVHIIFALILSVQNYRARGTERYAVVAKQEGVDWASKNMLVIGLVVLGFILLHLYNFWYNMQYAELSGRVTPYSPVDGISYIKALFSNVWYSLAYLVWLAALWFHLSHGIWSAMQSLGMSNNIWMPRLKVIGTILATLIVAMFAAVVIYYFFTSLAA